MTDDDVDMDDEELGRQAQAAHTAVDHWLAALAAASTQLYAEVTKEGRSHAAAVTWLSVRGVQVSPSTLSKLHTDADRRERWEPQSFGMYNRFGRAKAAEVSALGRRCAQLRVKLETARADLQRASGERKHVIAVAQTESDAIVTEVEEYLHNLHDALGRTPSWHPHAVIDDGFLDRKVTVVFDPERDLRQIATPNQLYNTPNKIIEGRVAWREAITSTRIAVVLADAGYGKSWLLKLYGRMLCREALKRLGEGELVADVALPLWLHAADLGGRWSAGEGPAASVLRAIGTVTAEKGYIPSRALREVLADRLTRSGPDVHILVDAFDEVFDDIGHQAAARTLRWLASLTTAKSGPRIVLTSRPSGYCCPFETTTVTTTDNARSATPRYLLLGVLSEEQVTDLWSQWYIAKDLQYPSGHLDQVVQTQSRVRQFARVPLIAAFCALVAETATVRPTKAGVYAQVLVAFLSLAWKADDRASPGTGPARDPAQQAAWDRALEDLAWVMATDQHGWCDAIEVAPCEDVLALRGPAPGDRVSRTLRLVREHGILVMLGGTAVGVAPKVLWIHRSVHEFLVARRLVGLPAEERMSVVELVISNSQWAGVRDFAWELQGE